MTGFFDNLKNKRVLITGSSRGIGKAMAIGFAKCGAKVIIHGRNNENALQETYMQIKEITNDVEVVAGNLDQKDTPQKIYDEVVEKAGGVDILILNASLEIRRPWLDISDEDAETQLQINFLSALRLIQLCVPDMIKCGWGRIITVGSVQQVKPHPDMLIYSAIKSALLNMTQSLALQLAETNITVNNVAPGTIYTDRNAKVLENKEYYQKVKNDTPMKKIGVPEDCVGMTLALCTDACSYITGENIFIGGGKHI